MVAPRKGQWQYRAQREKASAEHPWGRSLPSPYDSHPSLSKCVLSSESTHWDFGTEEMDSGQSLPALSRPGETGKEDFLKQWHLCCCAENWIGINQAQKRKGSSWWRECACAELGWHGSNGAWLPGSGAYVVAWTDIRPEQWAAFTGESHSVPWKTGLSNNDFRPGYNRLMTVGRLTWED